MKHIVADAGYGSEYNYIMILDRFEKQPIILCGRQPYIQVNPM